MIAGNHDCWGGDVLREDVGVDYHVRSVGGRRRRLARAHRARRRACVRREDRALSRAAPRAAQSARDSRRSAGCIPIWRRRSRRTARTRVGPTRARDRGPRTARSRPTRVASAIAISSCSSSGTRTSPRSSDCRAAASTRNAGSWLDAPTFLRVTDGARRAAPVGRISRECGSPRPRSFRRESAGLAAGTAADRRRR